MSKSSPPTTSFKRRPQPWYKRLTLALSAPQGGIPVARVMPRQTDCGPFVLSFVEPSAAFGESEAGPDSVNLDAMNFIGASLGEWRACHRTIELGISNWIYHLPRLHSSRIYPVPHPPYAIITAYWQLERVKHDIQLQPDDMAMLEDYLRHDYIAFLESEGGPNWKLRDETYKGKTIGGSPLPQYQIDDILAAHLKSPPSSYEPLTSNGMHWLRYLWDPMQGMPNTLNYTTVLLPDVLLTVCFHITRMNSEPWEDWWDLFMEDCEILVKTIACQRKELPGAGATASE
ncbi:TIGR04255 family protein [Rhodanobacter sp. Root179]|uniref:hypothetical protein n=1 Tax=unclassified Rhodanobacter TaxID=2621553 RepID=UPI000B1A09ED|nr:MULTISPECIES: hypothetical protein [unclassified Rhodanobacter]